MTNKPYRVRYPLHDYPDTHPEEFWTYVNTGKQLGHDIDCESVESIISYLSDIQKKFNFPRIEKVCYGWEDYDYAIFDYVRKSVDETEEYRECMNRKRISVIRGKITRLSKKNDTGIHDFELDELSKELEQLIGVS